ncbi:hypothetical protein BGX28_000929 [Mortierella sp. GBA30]|nr:hypothetical protein BGX28_000929 [Mortierella sp. GBA30]
MAVASQHTPAVGATTAVCSGAAIDNEALHKRYQHHQPVVTTGNITTPDGSVIGYTLHNNGGKANGTPLVVISGLGQVQTDWRDIVGHFASARRVLTFDNRGIGESSVLNVSLITRESAANDVNLLLNHLGWKDINLLGISLGTIISAEFMKNYAHDFNIEHLIMASSTYRNGNHGPLNDMVNEWLTAIPLPPSPKDWKEVIRKIFVGCLTPEYRENKKKQLAHFVARTDSGKNRNFATFFQQTQLTSIYNYSETVKRITSPTLILHGAQDIGQLVRSGRELHALMPGSAYVEYPDGGHMLFDTNPESIQDINKFLETK